MILLGIPLHPLFVHGAVVFIPVAALVSAAFVLRPDWRWALRLPTQVINVLALVALFTTRSTGERLAERTLEHKDLIERHDLFAGLLTASTIPLALLGLFAAWSFAGASPLPSGSGGQEARKPGAATATTVAICILALATVVLTVLTGHSGAVAAWTP